MTTRDCAHYGTPISVTTRHPNRRYCSPRRRVADWHARNRGADNDVANGANGVANDVNRVQNAVATNQRFDNVVRPVNGAAATPSTSPRSSAKHLRHFRIGCTGTCRLPQVTGGPSAQTWLRSLAMASCRG